MTIQLPILLWTLISFVVLMLVLNNLLFKPILSFMDARNEKISGTKKRKLENEEQLKEAQLETEKRRQIAMSLNAADAEKDIHEAKERAASIIAKINREGEEKLALCKAELEKNGVFSDDTLEKEAQKLAEHFARRLMNNK